MTSPKVVGTLKWEEGGKAEDMPYMLSSNYMGCKESYNDVSMCIGSAQQHPPMIDLKEQETTARLAVSP